MLSAHVAIFDATIDDRREWCVSLVVGEADGAQYSQSRLWTEEFGEAEESLIHAVDAARDFIRYGINWAQPLGHDGWVHLRREA